MAKIPKDASEIPDFIKEFIKETAENSEKIKNPEFKNYGKEKDKTKSDDKEKD